MTGSTTLRAALLAGTALVLPGIVMAQPAPNARPTGGQVVAGSATINQSNAARTQVTQSTDRAVVNWGSFDVGSGHTVQFQQPAATSMTLNRVTGPDPSQIAGRITANGGVAIVNQSGVVFHGGAQVDVGTLVVSSAGITNQAFMNGGGRLVFDQPGRPGARIENNGSITVRDTGLAALVAPQVANRGTITARMGRVALGGAETSVVDLHGDGMLSLELTSPVRQRPADGGALVSNDGVITATGGTVQLTAAAVDGIVQDLVRAGGRVNADTDAATGRTGRVVVAGTGGSVRIEGEVTARGLANGRTGGTIQAIGSDRTLIAATGSVDASGRAGGGRVELGTNGTGAAATRLSRRTGIAAGGTVRADATENGRGGTVLLNSTESTVHAGAISANGGPAGGDGGFVEVSGATGFSLTGRVDVRAGLGGSVGTLLVDPRDLTVVASASAQSPDDPVTGDATIGNAFINTFAGTLVLAATRDIVVDAAIAKTATGSLTLNAGNIVRLNAGITLSNGTLTLNGTNGTVVAPAVTLLQATDIVLAGGTVSKSTGNLTLTAGGFVTVNAPLVLAGGDLTIPGRVNINNLVQVPDANTVTINNDVTEAGAGRIVAGTLNVTSGLVHAMSGDNSVLTITNLVSTNETVFRNLRSLTINGTFGSQSSSFARLNVVGDITLANGGRIVGADGLVSVTATGDITTAVGSTISGEGVTLAAGGTLTLGSQLSSFDPGGPSVGPGAVTLTAGAGGITQTGGFVSASTLTVNSGGSALLDFVPISAIPDNRINALNPSNVAGDLRLVYRSNTTSNVTLNGAITAGGTLFLRHRGLGNTVQNTGSVITANRLDAIVEVNGLTLDGDNRIVALGNVTAESPLFVRNATALRVDGTVSANNAIAQIDVLGDLTVNGTVQGLQGVRLRAGGDVRLNTGSTVGIAFSGGFGTVPITVLAGVDFEIGSVDPGSTAGLTLGGAITNSVANQSVILGAGTGGIRQTGGAITAPLLFVSTPGDATLDAPGANAVGQLSAQAGGTFVLDNGTTNLLILGTNTAARYGIITAGTVTVRSDVAATERASFRVGGLSIPPPITGGSFPTPGGTVTAPLVEIAPATNVPVVLPSTGSPGALSVDPVSLGRIAASTLRVGATTFGGATTTTASGVTVNTFSWPGTLDLRATGNVGQPATATLSAGALTGIAGGSFNLANATNSLPLLGDITAGGFLGLRSTGAQTILGTLSAPTVSLTTGGALLESGPGRVAGGTLFLQTGGSATLTGANTISGLGASSVGGDLALANTSGQLTVPIGNLVNAAGVVVVAQNGGLVVDGTVTGTATTLGATGGATVTGNSAIARTGDLTINGDTITINGLIQAAGTIRLNAATLATLSGRAVGTNLSVTAPTIGFGGLDAATTPVDLFLGGSGTTAGTLSAAALRVFGGSSANLLGSIAGVGGEPAAALGRRGTAGGTVLSEPLPNQTAFLFNNCPIGVAVCRPVIVPTPVPTPGPTPATSTPDVTGLVTVADAPNEVVFALDPAANLPLLDRLRPAPPNIAVRLFRDRSEEDELAPPNVRGEDY